MPHGADNSHSTSSEPVCAGFNKGNHVKSYEGGHQPVAGVGAVWRLAVDFGRTLFSSLKSDKENFTVLQTIRQQQLQLSESRVDLLQARNSLNRAGIRYMMDTNKIGSGATIDELLGKAKEELAEAERHYAAYEKSLRIRVRIPSRQSALSNSTTFCTARSPN